MSPQSYGPIGKIAAGGVLLTVPSGSPQSLATVTGTDGAWSFAHVRSPGYYLLTFAKPGYQTQRYIVDSTSAVATQPLKINLTAGQGSLSGRISGPSGSVGGAQISITDGTNTITTSSNSKGDVGAWSISGLSTPSSYLVSASKNGMSAESALLTLDAGGTSAVNLTLKVGVTTLSGKVEGPDSVGNTIGLGGVQVTATDGTVSRSASTVTSGTVAGNYTLPDLPPGTYSVTVQAPGYLPQTQQILIKPGQGKATLNSTLNSASATVTGVVTGVQFNSDGSVVVGPGGTPKVGPINGAGLTMTSAANTYKITSGADGSFRINGVTPGTYGLSAQYSGLTTSFATVQVLAGQVDVVPSTALALTVDQSPSTSSITGFVASAVSPSGTLTCPTGTAPGADCHLTFSLSDSAGNSVFISTASKTGPFSLTPTVNPSTVGPTGYSLWANPGLTPGLYRLTIGSTGFLPATVSVRVPLNTAVAAPQVNLFPANTISGTIDALGNITTDGPVGLSGVAAPPYTNCVWAIPVGSAQPDPTKSSTPCAYTPPTVSQCQTKGLAEVGFSLLDPTTHAYTVGGLCDGTYNVYVAVTNPWYIDPAPTASQTVTHGQTVTYSPHVARKGHVLLTMKEVDPASGSISTPSSLQGSASCGGVSQANLSTISNGVVVVQGVGASGSVTCTAATTSTPVETGTVSHLSVGNDADTPAAMTLSQSIISVYG
ncbi:MAG: carboxypeptidase-like regulatory domain-containing protein, partial [Actinomycetota bacterium]|nr:carboxypeptidase-like regulatory domain-containing protein [Actinomycetota bacterium]